MTEAFATIELKRVHLALGALLPPCAPGNGVRQVGEVLAELEGARESGKRVVLLVVDCFGGLAQAGLALFEGLRRFSEAGGRTVAYVEHAAYSTAAVFVPACDVVVCDPTGGFYPHGIGVMPDLEWSDEAATGLGALVRLQIAAVEHRTLAAPSDVERWMGTLCTPEEPGGELLRARRAVALGFADFVGDRQSAVALARELAAGREVQSPRRTLLAEREKQPASSEDVTLLRLVGAEFVLQAQATAAPAAGCFTNNLVTDPLIAGTSGLVRPDHLALVAAKLPVNWGEMRKFALDNFSAAREHEQNAARALREAMNEMGGSAAAPGSLEKFVTGMLPDAAARVVTNKVVPLLIDARDTGFIAYEMADRWVTTLIGTARYNQTMSRIIREARVGAVRNLNTEEAEAAHLEAVRDANDAIQQVLPPTDIADKPTFMRSRGLLGALTLFAGHSNKMWNLYYRRPLADIGRVWRSDESSVADRASVVAKFAGRLLFTSIVNGVIAEYVAGSGQQDDEDKGEWFMRKCVAGASYPLPPLLGAAVAVLGDRAVTGKWHKQSIRTAPGLEFIERIGGDALKALSGDQSAGAAAATLTELFVGMAIKAPTRQSRQTFDYLSKLSSGQSRPRGPGDVAGGLLYGEDKHGSANIGTDLQDLASGRR